ncbi:MAG: hypothetical protein AAB416_02545, partial [Patescibacteria group bacterium]
MFITVRRIAFERFSFYGRRGFFSSFQNQMHKAGEEGDEYYPADDWKEVLVDIRNGVTQNV